MANFIDIKDRVGRSEPKHYKTTLFRSEELMLGLNCLEPGQEQRVHTHADQDKFYLVLEGTGTFTVGGEERAAGPFTTVWAPRGIEHGVRNTGSGRLVLFMGMAPPPS
jgi:quercetin dioxygenase-like cupin family protein